MQVVEKSSEGLSRVIAVTIPVAELNVKLDAKIKEVAPQMKLKGFRPGKVPTSYVKKTFGCVFHPLGTASMLPREDGGVVDPELRVYGTANVRVVSVRYWDR